MLFNSFEFIFLFLPATLFGYVFIDRYYSREYSIVWLVLASLFFYGWWNPIYLVLIIGSMFFNFYFGKLISFNRQNVKKTKLILTIGIIVNLALLGYFKYANFFINNVNDLMGTSYNLEHIILPLAISFFTFQQIAYLVDSYFNITKEYQFSHYALFVTFFPQLIAGPIVHHSEMLHQFTENKNNNLISTENISIGLTIFAIGLFKKAVLADGIAPYGTSVFTASANGEPISFFIAWGGALAYTLQLYFDFSGYSDMAIGAARIFGIKLPLNFYSPYKSKNIIEFWRRWHMTLSRFLRDYLYIPLGGSRKGTSRRYINLFITMLLGGLWHGAGWTFIIWGALHGSYLTVNHLWREICGKFNIEFTSSSKVWGYFSWFITFIAVVIGWVYFRAEDLHSANTMVYAMFNLNNIAIPNAIAVKLGDYSYLLDALGISTFLGGGSQFIFTYLWIIFLLPIAIILPNPQQLLSKFNPAFDVHTPSTTHSIQPFLLTIQKIKWKPEAQWAIIIGLILCVGILALTSISEFLYFQF